MKRIAIFLMTALAACSLVSCNESDTDFARYSIFAVVHQGASGYYFESDDHKTLYPADRSRVPSYVPKDGDRVIIAYNLLEGADQKVPGFDYTIALYASELVPWGETDTVADEEALKAEGEGLVSLFRDDLVSSTTERMNVAVAYLAKDMKKHTFRLVRVEDYTPDQTADGYLNLELVHDAGDDVTTGVEPYAHWVSFELSEFSEQIEGTKGVIIGMTALDKQRKSVKIDWLTFE